jgi:hypothetical protein
VEHCFVVVAVACVWATGGIGLRKEGQLRKVGVLQSRLGSLPAALGDVGALARHPEQC